MTPAQGYPHLSFGIGLDQSPLDLSLCGAFKHFYLGMGAGVALIKQLNGEGRLLGHS